MTKKTLYTIIAIFLCTAVFVGCGTKPPKQTLLEFGARLSSLSSADVEEDLEEFVSLVTTIYGIEEKHLENFDGWTARLDDEYNDYSKDLRVFGKSSSVIISVEDGVVSQVSLMYYYNVDRTMATDYFFAFAENYDLLTAKVEDDFGNTSFVDSLYDTFDYGIESDISTLWRGYVDETAQTLYLRLLSNDRGTSLFIAVSPT